MIRNSSVCRFMVTDLSGAFDFRVTLTFSICLEDGAACEQEVVLLNNALLPRQSCDFNIGTPITSKKYPFFGFIEHEHILSISYKFPDFDLKNPQNLMPVVEHVFKR